MVTAFILFAVSIVLVGLWVYFGIKGFISLFTGNRNGWDGKRWAALLIGLPVLATLTFTLSCIAGVLGLIALF